MDTTKVKELNAKRSFCLTTKRATGEIAFHQYRIKSRAGGRQRVKSEKEKRECDLTCVKNVCPRQKPQHKIGIKRRNR